MKTLIKNGRIVTAVDDYKADILIDGETVSVIGAKLDMEADKVIDAAGKLVIPGGIDAHTHMDMPFGGTTSADDFRTGTLAAAHGGTTTIIDFAIQTKGQSIVGALDTWHEKAASAATRLVLTARRRFMLQANVAGVAGRSRHHGSEKLCEARERRDRIHETVLERVSAAKAAGLRGLNCDAATVLGG